MPPLTTRDALAEALHNRLCSPMTGADFPCESCRDDAAALLASGALIDATKLAEDERVRRFARLSERDDVESLIGPDAAYVARLLAAALSAQSERAEVER